MRISILESLGENIFTRITMKDFLSHISKIKENKVILDFKKVKFISRSCADEFIKFLDITKKDIESINMSSDVSMMLKVVKNSLAALEVSKSDSSSCVVCE